MSIWGKILGSAAGFALGGPLGALAGAVAGHAVDLYRAAPDPSAAEDPRAATRQIAFTIATIVLGAKLAKADGVVSRHEIGAFKEVFHIPAEEMGNVARLYDRAKQEATGYGPYAEQIARLLRGHPAVLEDLLDALFHIAHADGAVHEAEIAYLHDVAALFGFSDDDFRRIRAANGVPEEDDPHVVLGVTSASSEEEVKAAYRRLAAEHHPDRLVAEGLPQEFVDIANDKMAAINEAYRRIREIRREA